MKFTTRDVAKLKLPADKIDLIVFDDDLPGFGIRLRPHSRTYVIQGRTAAGQWRSSLGDIRKLTLEDARKIARRRFAEVELGGDPRAAKAEARARAELTLGAQSDRYLETRKDVQRSSSYASNKRYFNDHFKSLRGLPLNRIARRDVAVAISNIASQRGKVAAARARSALSAFFSWAMREGIAEENPVIGTNRPDEGVDSRERVLAAAELKAIWNASGDDDFGRIVRLLMLTACRRDEIGALRWSEIDFDRAMLVIPGDRVKNHQELRLPLSGPALAILATAPRRADREFVFGDRGADGFSSWSAATAALHARIGDGVTAAWRLHDIRRSVSTHMGEELGVLPHVVEAILNHQSGTKAGVAGIYNKSRYDREKTQALTVFAEYLRSIVEGTEHKVVPLRTANA